MNNKIQAVFSQIHQERLKKRVSLSKLAEDIDLGEDWLSAVEKGETTPSFELVYAIAEAANIDLSNILNKLMKSGKAITVLSRKISAKEDGNGNLIFTFQYNDYQASYKLQNATLAQYSELLSSLREKTYNKDIKKSEYVIETFFKAIELWPDANPSDIWGFFLSRLYQDPYNHPVTEQHRDYAQSWKRTSGWVLEEIFVRHYKEFLHQNGVTIGIYPKKEVKEYLRKMNLNYHDVEEKADVLVIDNNSGECFGVIHVKASLAERRQADQSFSEALMSKSYFSPFMTMDCKSFPSAKPVNKGELGPVKTAEEDQRINKRLDFEEEGYFSACYSYNTNTLPTPPGQKAAARVYVMDFKHAEDVFSRAVISARNRLFAE